MAAGATTTSLARASSQGVVQVSPPRSTISLARERTHTAPSLTNTVEVLDRFRHEEAGPSTATVNSVPRTSISLSGVVTTKRSLVPSLATRACNRPPSSENRRVAPSSSTCSCPMGDSRMRVPLPKARVAVLSASERTLSPTARTPRSDSGCVEPPRTSRFPCPVSRSTIKADSKADSVSEPTPGTLSFAEDQTTNAAVAAAATRMADPAASLRLRFFAAIARAMAAMMASRWVSTRAQSCCSSESKRPAKRAYRSSPSPVARSSLSIMTVPPGHRAHPQGQDLWLCMRAILDDRAPGAIAPRPRWCP